MKPFPMKVRRVAYERASGRCERCGAVLGDNCGHAHHRLPKRVGGSTRGEIQTVSNCLIVCDFCHRFIHEGLAKESREKYGWLLPSSCSPAETKVLYQLTRWVYLRGDGTVTEVKNG